MPRNSDTVQGCKCPACLESERREADLGVPYRAEAGGWRRPFPLALHASLPLLGAVLIGRSWWAAVPVLGAFGAYVANALLLCPTCSYHHAGVRFCGCYPKSVFSLRRYRGRPWGWQDNLAGRSLVISLTIIPTMLVLAGRDQGMQAVTIAVAAVLAVFLTSIVSCPSCRQRSFCWLGRLTVAGIKRKDI